jgi:hypothetical protein
MKIKINILLLFALMVLYCNKRTMQWCEKGMDEKIIEICLNTPVVNENDSLRKIIVNKCDSIAIELTKGMSELQKDLHISEGFYVLSYYQKGVEGGDVVFIIDKVSLEIKCMEVYQ